MAVVVSLLLWLFCCVVESTNSPITPLVMVEMYPTASTVQQHAIIVFGVAADFGAKIPNADQFLSKLELVETDPPNACSNKTTLVHIHSSSRKPAALITRADRNCSFVEQIRHAQNAGAAVVIVRDTAAAIYANEESLPSEKFDCQLSRGISKSNSAPSGGTQEDNRCARNDACPSKQCILTGKVVAVNSDQGDGIRFETCCATGTFIRMMKSASSNQQLLPTIPSVFVRLVDGEILQRGIRMNAQNKQFQTKVEVYLPSESPWNISMLLIWALGSLTVVSSAMYSARRERVFSRQVVASNYSLGDQFSQKNMYVPIEEAREFNEEDAPVNLQARHAILFLIMGSTSLILMYYINLLEFVCVMFMISGILSFTTVVSLPAILAIWPHLDDLGINFPIGYVSLADALSLIPSIILGVTWYVERKSPLIWIARDILGVCLCFVFIDSIQFSSLRVATYLLLAAFIYDVFFVYISPYIFGHNVMIAVASGGASVKFHTNDLCSLYPKSPECNNKETMPLILSIPLIFSHFGGEAMLGLGDIVLPGLLLSFALRYDYCMGNPVSKGYFSFVSVAYAFGLLIANVMAIVLRFIVAGQPALMYIVPITLGTFVIIAKQKDELSELWNGPSCLHYNPDLVDD